MSYADMLRNIANEHEQRDRELSGHERQGAGPIYDAEQRAEYRALADAIDGVESRATPNRSAIPPNTEPARRHCYEVAHDMLWIADRCDTGAVSSPQEWAHGLRALAARLLEGVEGRYSTGTPDE